MRFTCSILIVFILASCAKNKSIVGLYGKCERGYLACTQIELKSDSTFTLLSYSDVGGASFYYGDWIHVSTDSIMLLPPKKSRTLFTEKINPELTGKLKVTILDDGDEYHSQSAIENVLVIINEPPVGKVTDANGVVLFDNPQTQKIICRFLSIYDETFDLSSSEINDVQIIIKDIYIKQPVYETMKISNDGLRYTEQLTLKKTRMRNKQWK